MEQYFNQIESGDIVTSKRVFQQYSKLMERFDHTPDHMLFDLDFANAPINFIEAYCKQSKGKWIGKNLKLELFQKAKMQAVFGFVYRDSLLRVCREVMTTEGRKNGKSTEAAGIGQFGLVGDGEAGAEIYPVATKLDQAQIIFKEAVNMRAQSIDLRSVTKKTKYELTCPSNYGSMRPLASDSKSMDGLNVHYGLLDEIHAWKDRNLYDIIVQATSSRDQPLIYIISTGGFIREGLYDNKYEYGCKVLDGIFEDEQRLFFFYELDKRSEWTDPSCWIKANPGLGTIKKFDTLAKFVEDAKNDAQFLPSVLTKDFNVRETREGSWLEFEVLENNDTYSLEYLMDSYAVGGVDLSSTTDLCCATLLVQKSGDTVNITVEEDGEMIVVEKNKTYCIQQYFIPAEVLQKKIKEDNVPYDVWRDRGLVTICPGSTVDYHAVTVWYLKMFNEYGIRPLWIGYDPWNSTYWVNEMVSQGFTMEIVRQGAQTLSQPMKQLGGDLGDKLVNYNNNPVLKWCLSNLCAKTDENGNIRPMKHHNVKLRIDGGSSLLAAYAKLFEHLQDYLNMIS